MLHSFSMTTTAGCTADVMAMGEVVCAIIQNPTFLNAMANTASTMMTTVMDDTTDAVVPAPRLWVLGSTRSPQWQPVNAINTPKTIDLVVANHRLPICTASGNACMK